MKIDRERVLRVLRAVGPWVFWIALGAAFGVLSFSVFQLLLEP